MRIIKIGSRHYIPLEHIIRFETDTDRCVKVYLREMIANLYPRWIKTPPFRSFEEAEVWIASCYENFEL